MKGRMKKVLALLLCSAIGLSVSACGATSNDPANESVSDTGQSVDSGAESTAAAEVSGDVVPGWQKHADEKVTLSWYINYSWFPATWGGNLVSDTVTELTGVDIEFVVPAGNESEKLNSMIASDTLPDILTIGAGTSQIEDMIEAGMIYALNELADEYDAYFWTVVNEERAGWYTKEDGNFYGYPNISTSPSDIEANEGAFISTQTFLVRKDMYEAIGSPDMTTPEGFIKAIKDAAEMFPEVNGRPIIPFGTHEFTSTGNYAFESYLQNFLAIPYEQDGVAYDRLTDPEYVEWLKVFRSLGAEGYLSDDIFIDTRTQMDEKIAQGRYFCMLYQRSDITDPQKALYANDPDSIYLAIDGPKNSAGDDPTLSGPSITGWTLTMISKNCEHPDRAIELLSYLMSEEGQLMMYMGVEGVTYDMVDSEAVMKEEIIDLANNDNAAYTTEYGGMNTYWMMADTVMQIPWVPATVAPMDQVEDWTRPYVSSMAQYNYILPSDSDEANILLKVNNEWSSTLPKLLLASTEEEFDELFNKFLDKREAYGYDKVLEEYTRQLKENKRKLGIE